mgnify:FL=1
MGHIWVILVKRESTIGHIWAIYVSAMVCIWVTWVIYWLCVGHIDQHWVIYGSTIVERHIKKTRPLMLIAESTIRWELSRAAVLDER